MEIRVFEEKYRDDTIFMIMETKVALGRVPRLNEDLLDVKANYFDKGGMFWVAVDENDRVIGSGGFLPVEGTTEARVKRLYVKASMKRRGIGSALLETIEEAMRSRGFTVARLRLGTDPEQWFESYAFYPKHGYTMYQPRHMMKELLPSPHTEDRL